MRSPYQINNWITQRFDRSRPDSEFEFDEYPAPKTYERSSLNEILLEAFNWFKSGSKITDCICKIFFDLDYEVDEEIIDDLCWCSTLLESTDEAFDTFLTDIEIAMKTFDDFFDDYKNNLKPEFALPF